MNRSSKPAFGTLLFFAIAFALSLYFAFAAIQGNYGLFRRAEIVAEAICGYSLHRCRSMWRGWRT